MSACQHTWVCFPDDYCEKCKVTRTDHQAAKLAIYRKVVDDANDVIRTEAGGMAELRRERDEAVRQRDAARATIEAWKPLLVTVRGYFQSIDDCGEACVEMMQMMGRIDAALEAEKSTT